MSKGFNSNSIMSRKDPHRAGKTKRKSTLMCAIARYLRDKGPCLASEAYFNARLKSGKKAHNYGSVGTIVNVMKMRSDFYIAGEENPQNIQSAKLWMVELDSELLD